MSPQLRPNSIGYLFRLELRPIGMTPRIICRAFLPLFLGLFLLAVPSLADEARRIQIRTDFSEAVAALGILDKRNASLPVADSDWQTLLVTEPYQRLKKREAAMQCRPWESERLFPASLGWQAPRRCHQPKSV